MNQTLKEKYPGYGNLGNILYKFNGNIIPFGSSSLESLKIVDGITIYFIKRENDEGNKKSLKSSNDLISINLISSKGEFKFLITVSKHTTCGNLITLLNQIIEKMAPNYYTKGNFFIHNNKKLIYNARKLESLNFKDGDIITVHRIEDDNIIDDNCNLKDFKEYKDLISIKLISTDQCIHLNVIFNKNTTCTELIATLIDKIRIYYPQKLENELCFICG